MSTISLRLPESLHKQVRDLAKQEGISINQFAATAIAEKLSALLTSDYLEKRAQHGSRAKFEQALSKVSDVPPDTRDALE
ncbi:MAG: type II toxin-antitoxin system HicB family antitoxin [Armatimonadota bacterium]|nr:type II toxin-antitoxin system HicB family antitoxin [Armatimonadota bacterium]